MKNEFQKKVKEFMDENKINNPVEYRMLDLVDEIGELSKEICKMAEYGTKEPVFRQEVKTELGDVFYSLITVANYYKVDLMDALDIVINKYKKRIEKGGHAGSDND